MIQKLANAIGYPDKVPDDVDVYAFRVDGGECVARKRGAGLILEHRLVIDSDDLAVFAAFAAGRMLREEAVFAWDDRAECAVLWCEVPPGADQARLRESFEAFLDSCDWWDQRSGEKNKPHSAFPDIMIRP